MNLFFKENNQRPVSVYNTEKTPKRLTIMLQMIISNTKKATLKKVIHEHNFWGQVC